MRYLMLAIRVILMPMGFLMFATLFGGMTFLIALEEFGFGWAVLAVVGQWSLTALWAYSNWWLDEERFGQSRRK